MAKKKDDWLDYWYPRFPVRYRRKTISWRDLRLHGAYCLLIDHYMLTKEAIPDDDGAIANILGCDLAEWLAVADKVRSMFEARDGKLYQSTCDEELRKQRRIADRNRRNGKGGGRPKGSTNKEKTEKPSGLPVATQSGGQKKPHNITEQNTTSPSLHSGEDSPPPARAAQAALLADFKVWYAKYPRKVAPRKAEGAYLAARRRGATAEDLLAGLDRYMRTKPEYADWAHPTTWLNGDRWKDGIAPDGVATDADAPVPLDESLEPYREKLEKQFDRATLASWFKPSVRLHEDDGWFTLIAPTPFHAGYMQTNYQTRLRAVFGDQFHGVTHRKRAA